MYRWHGALSYRLCAVSCRLGVAVCSARGSAAPALCAAAGSAERMMQGVRGACDRQRHMMPPHCYTYSCQEPTAASVNPSPAELQMR
ncbi:hypothetical protein GDO81_030218 [Engystomops pustulosus]|uniref:Secreted protein n=1 Tax=Engystomops pustulosus TaxID=76066 RepID=A0AAV6YGT4_ENGPU|nr:hypothetical protein GDO81_030218 [Engystomops pustulosus]